MLSQNHPLTNYLLGELAQASVHPTPEQHRDYSDGTAASRRSHALRAVRQLS